MMKNFVIFQVLLVFFIQALHGKKKKIEKRKIELADRLKRNNGF